MLIQQCPHCLFHPHVAGCAGGCVQAVCEGVHKRVHITRQLDRPVTADVKQEGRLAAIHALGLWRQSSIRLE